MNAPAWRECPSCGRRHQRGEPYCNRCLPPETAASIPAHVFDDVARLRATRPYAVRGFSAFESYDLVNLGGEATLGTARWHAGHLAAAGYTGLRVVDERTGAVVWTAPRTAVAS